MSLGVGGGAEHVPGCSLRLLVEQDMSLGVASGYIRLVSGVIMIHLHLLVEQDSARLF